MTFRFCIDKCKTSRVTRRIHHNNKICIIMTHCIKIWWKKLDCITELSLLVSLLKWNIKKMVLWCFLTFKSSQLESYQQQCSSSKRCPFSRTPLIPSPFHLKNKSLIYFLKKKKIVKRHQHYFCVFKTMCYVVRLSLRLGSHCAV